MVYDISNPEEPGVVHYVNRRDFTFARTPLRQATLARRHAFHQWADSPIERPLEVIGNEISGSMPGNTAALLYPAR